MKHLDAKAVRERLNTVMLALSTLERCSSHKNHSGIAATAKNALREIAVLVTDDELEEHQVQPEGELRRMRRRIRAFVAPHGAGNGGAGPRCLKRQGRLYLRRPLLGSGLRPEFAWRQRAPARLSAPPRRRVRSANFRARCRSPR